MQRHADTCHFSHFTAPQAGTIDHKIGLDFPLVRHHTSDLSVGLVDRGNLDAFETFHPTLARTLHERRCDIDRTGGTVLGNPTTSE